MASQAIRRGEPVENIADVLPCQGAWPESMYFGIIQRRHVEYTDGDIEILPMPTTSHQRILLFLLQLLIGMAQATHPGEALPAGVKLRIRRGKVREPDLVYVSAANADAYIGEQFWTGADLVVEVVSPDNPERDYADKRFDYAEGKVPEYWIVDPLRKTFTVLTLRGDEYTEHGVYHTGESADSVLLSGVTVDVAAVFAAGRIA